MKNHSGVMARSVLSGLLLMCFISGCSTSRVGTRDRAFIVYWPPKNSQQLRLAVKDLIDVKGVVTTAGSEYFARPVPRLCAMRSVWREQGSEMYT